MGAIRNTSKMTLHAPPAIRPCDHWTWQLMLSFRIVDGLSGVVPFPPRSDHLRRHIPLITQRAPSSRSRIGTPSATTSPCSIRVVRTRAVPRVARPRCLHDKRRDGEVRELWRSWWLYFL